MVNRNLLRQFDLSEEELNEAFGAPKDGFPAGAEPDWLPEQQQEYEVDRIVSGKVLHIVEGEVWIDVGYKSEGIIPLEEWQDEGPGGAGQGEPGAAQASRRGHPGPFGGGRG